MQWIDEITTVNWEELSALYRIAPLGDKRAEDLRVAFANSRFVCFVYDGAMLVGVGRVLADGVDCAYLCDVAVHPKYQRRGLGRAIVNRLKELSAGHRKIILYANPGKEPLYAQLGFHRMKTAMAIFKDNDLARSTGLIE